MDPIQKHALSRSVQLEAVYPEALLYLLYYFLVEIRITFLLFSATKNILPENFVVKERGKIIVKGKGELLTYWMEYKPNRLPPPKNKVSISHQICLFKFDIMYVYHSHYQVLDILEKMKCIPKSMRTFNV